MKREINIKVIYNLDNILEITPKEKVKEMLEKYMINYFGWDEGYNGIEVDVNDYDTFL